MSTVTVTIRPDEFGYFQYRIQWPNGGSVSGPARTYSEAVVLVAATLSGADPYPATSHETEHKGADATL